MNMITEISSWVAIILSIGGMLCMLSGFYWVRLDREKSMQDDIRNIKISVDGTKTEIGDIKICIGRIDERLSHLEEYKKGA